MEGLFLIIWFYLYAGLNFAVVSNSLALFPKIMWLIQTLIWPVLLLLCAVKTTA